MHQHLRDLMSFLYFLLSATWEAETKWTENKVVPTRIKAANVEGKLKKVPT